MTLSSLIIKEIKRFGPISFRDFMEMALYYPGLGYYTSHKKKIGKTGDYYTSSNLTPVFGEMLGKQIQEMWHILGKKEMTVVEMGAGTGLLSGDVLTYLANSPELFHDLNYCIVEKSPYLLKEQQDRLTHEKVNWYNSISELKGMRGCIFSNELPDAFPVHVVEMENELMEVFVGYENGFIEILKPASDQLRDYLKELEVTLPFGYRTEINLDAIKWIREMGSALEKGFVISIDYGYSSRELYQDYRNRGTLLCYYNHTVNESPFEHIGEQDITSHVNFSALDHWGQKKGLYLCGFTDQAHFLMGLRIDEYLKNLQEKSPVDYFKKMLPIKSLIMDMGGTFKVMIQKKGVEFAELSGLKFPSEAPNRSRDAG
ncbi:MAG TPA: SAM-dependent methyltransferase [Candidatus Methanoperedens sp.]|nr:SAM-dependent methyltransferase [Candidatus Methanoperedens sp.]